MSQYNAQCDFCQQPTNNDRDSDGELLCHTCRQAEAQRQADVDLRLRSAAKVALRKLPEALATRVHKAYDLALSGYVQRNGTGYHVQSQTEAGKVYHVNGAGCDCPDAAHGAPTIAGKPRCKHQLAVDLARKADTYEVTQGGAVRPKRSQGKNRWKWCDRCKDMTKHAFGVGCKTCLEDRERATALPVSQPRRKSKSGSR